ncbi:MAG: hypothetical protein R2729_25645 [Bryobacteraceae bacterium]
MRPALCILAATVCLAAQPRVFQATATAPVRVEPALASVFVGLRTADPLETVLRRLAPAGITSEHLVGFSNTWQPTMRPLTGAIESTYSFTLTMPIARAGSVLSELKKIAPRPETQPGLPILVPVPGSAPFAYSIAYVADPVAVRVAGARALDGLYTRAATRLDMAAAGTGPVRITRAELPYIDSLALYAETGSAPARRSVVVNVSLPASVPLDTGEITVSLRASTAPGNAAVTHVLTPAGITGADLVEQSLDNEAPSATTYTYSLRRPRNDAEDLLAALRDMLQPIPSTWTEASVSFAYGTSNRAKEAAWDAALPSLIEQARHPAEVLAKRMHGRLGAVRSVTEGRGALFLDLSVPSLTQRFGSREFAARVEFFVE